MRRFHIVAPSASNPLPRRIPHLLYLCYAALVGGDVAEVAGVALPLLAVLAAVLALGGHSQMMSALRGGGANLISYLITGDCTG